MIENDFFYIYHLKCDQLSGGISSYHERGGVSLPASCPHAAEISDPLLFLIKTE